MQSHPIAVAERLRDAMNRHDLEAVLACIDPDYQSEQPAHPVRGFGGREQVRKNWAALFAAVPDFHAELLRATVQGDMAWTEWRWYGTRRDGSAFDMRGVALFGVRDDRIVWGRLYMEETEVGGADIDATMRRLTAESAPQD